jgi:hypothetical protein
MPVISPSRRLRQVWLRRDRGRNFSIPGQGDLLRPAALKGAVRLVLLRPSVLRARGAGGGTREPRRATIESLGRGAANGRRPRKAQRRGLGDRASDVLRDGQHVTSWPSGICTGHACHDVGRYHAARRPCIEVRRRGCPFILRIWGLRKLDSGFHESNPASELVHKLTENRWPRSASH